MNRRGFLISSATAASGAAFMNLFTQDALAQVSATPIATDEYFGHLELIKSAILAPSSHNTQPWKFKLSEKMISIFPDFSRRCPAVDPDDHHLFVSLGCAAENLAQAALASGLMPESKFDFSGSKSIELHFSPTKARASSLYQAIRVRQCTRTEYGDGLYSATTGNPNIPTWLGKVLFTSIFTEKSENEKYVKQIRSSAGIAIFSSEKNDSNHWIEAGRCFERFALQATSMGIRSAMINQPVEVPSIRPVFASYLGLGKQRPDLVVRFGRAPLATRSMRRELSAVLI